MSGPPPTTARSAELRGAARGSLVTFVGASASALLGFAFNVVLARSLGASGAGVVLQGVAAFTIALSIARLGLDTTAVWLLPRLMGTERSLVRQALVGVLVPAGVATSVVTLGWWGARGLGAFDRLDPRVVEALSLMSLFLPAAALMTVALAATRAFGGVLPYNLVQNLVVPGLRPAGVALAAALGGGTAAAAVGWAAPWLVGAVLALVVVSRQVLRATRGEEGRWTPGRDVARRIRTFALPRVVASGLEQSILWLDVVLVGILLGAEAAGVYGTVSRFVSVGAIVATALRIVVAPRFSALLGEGRVAEVEDLYSVTARWILLFGSPAYVGLAVFAPTVLGWLGPDFGSGALSMVLLCAGSVVVLAAGNVQALLLMSGRSLATAVNKGVVLAVNILGNLLLVPQIGIVGAAATWAFSMVLDTALAVWQVRRGVGVSVAAGPIGLVLLVVTLAVAAPSVAVVLVLGQGLGSLLLAATLSVLTLGSYVWLDRERLRLHELRGLRRRTPSRRTDATGADRED